MQPHNGKSVRRTTPHYIITTHPINAAIFLQSVVTQRSPHHQPGSFFHRISFTVSLSVWGSTSSTTMRFHLEHRTKVSRILSPLLCKLPMTLKIGVRTSAKLHLCSGQYLLKVFQGRNPLSLCDCIKDSQGLNLGNLCDCITVTGLLKN